MNALISTMESDSQWVLTQLANQRLILWLQRFLYCLFLTHRAFICFLLTIFLLFPSWILTLSLSRSQRPSSHTYLEKGPWSNTKIMFWRLIIMTVPCHIAKFTRLSRSLHAAKSFTDQDIMVFCRCYYYTLEDLGHCPILGRGQEVRVAVFSALHSD